MNFTEFLYNAQDLYDLEDQKSVEEAYSEYLEIHALEYGQGLEDVLGEEENQYSDEEIAIQLNDFYSQFDEEQLAATQDLYSQFLKENEGEFESDLEAQIAFTNVLTDSYNDFEDEEEYDDEEDYEDEDFEGDDEDFEGEDEDFEGDDEDYEDEEYEDEDTYSNQINHANQGVTSTGKLAGGIKRGTGLAMKHMKNIATSPYTQGVGAGAALGAGGAAYATRQKRAQIKDLAAKKRMSGLTPAEETQLQTLRKSVRSTMGIATVASSIAGAGAAWGAGKLKARNSNHSDAQISQMLEDAYAAGLQDAEDMYAVWDVKGLDAEGNSTKKPFKRPSKAGLKVAKGVRHVKRNKMTYGAGAAGAGIGAGLGAMKGASRRKALATKVANGTATPAEIAELRTLKAQAKRNMAIGAVAGAAVGAGGAKYGKAGVGKVKGMFTKKDTAQSDMTANAGDRLYAAPDAARTEKTYTGDSMIAALVVK